MIKSILPLSLTTFLSRITGFLRDYVLYHAIGSGPNLDVFFVAFRFPQLTRRFFAEGSFHQALLPIMAQASADPDPERAQRLYSASFWFVTLLMLCLALSIWVYGSAWIDYLLAPGFSSGQKKLLADCLIWTAPYSLALSWVSLLALLLQLNHSYWLNGISPTILNIFVGFAAYFYSADIVLVAQSVFIAGWIQSALHAVLTGTTLSFKRCIPLFVWPDQDFWNVWSRFLSLSGLSILILINMSIDQIYLSYAPIGSVSIYYLCERVIELPIGIIGYSLWSVFSTYYVQNHQNALSLVRLEYQILLLILAWVVPASAFILFFAADIMMFFMGASSPLVQNASALLNIISLQILFIVINKIFVIIFTTHGRNKEILLIHGLGSIVNCVMNALLYSYGAQGIALSTLCTLFIQLLVFHLRYPLFARLTRLPIRVVAQIFYPLMLLIGAMAFISTRTFKCLFWTSVPQPIVLTVFVGSASWWYWRQIQPFFAQMNQRVTREALQLI